MRTPKEGQGPELAVISAERLPQTGYASTFQYESLLLDVRSKRSLEAISAKWWVCFDLGGTHTGELDVLSKLFGWLLETRSNVIAVGSATGPIIRSAGNAIGHAPKQWDPLEKYTFEPSDGNRSFLFNLRLKPEFEQFLAQLGASTPPGTRLWFMKATNRRRVFTGRSILRIARTREPISTLFVPRRGGSITFLPFTNISPSVDTAFLLQDYVKLWLPNDNEDPEVSERHPLKRTFPDKSPLVRGSARRGENYRIETLVGIPGVFEHDRSFHHIRWKGEDHSLIDARAHALQILHEEFCNGRAPVHQGKIVDAINHAFGKQFEDLGEVFRKTEYWGGLIKRVKNDLYTLGLRKPCCPTVAKR